MDMLVADLQLKNDAAPRKGKAKESNEEEAGFHFIAFVPVEGKVWKLDGLQRQPENLGKLRSWLAGQEIVLLTRAGPVTGTEWVMQVAPEIESRMAQYEDGQIEFAILALVQEPLTNLVAALAENVRSIVSVSQRLDQLRSDWRHWLLDRTGGKDLIDPDVVLGPCKQYDLDQDAIDGAVLSPSLKAQLDGNNADDLAGTRQDFIMAQAGLRRSIKDEALAIQADNARAASRPFLTIFHTLHPNYQAPIQVRFRLRLLKFAHVFTTWCNCSSNNALSKSKENEGPEIHAPTTTTRAKGDFMYLRETLPMFLALSAVQNAIQESTITELWMRLAAGYMAQAYAEQVLSCQNEAEDLLDGVFSWGFDPDCSASEESDERQLNTMFDTEEDLADLWAEIKEEHVRAVSQIDPSITSTFLADAIVHDSFALHEEFRYPCI
ncbi:MAG: hypothetical protein Q9174_000498 [Haloplaca sp. 1 TL-2023]